VSSAGKTSAIERLPPLREVVRAHDLAARKSLGQHFLFDLNLTRRIARAAGDLGHGTTIEIGPGPGGLTRALLLEGASAVLAVERDERCLAALYELRAAAGACLEIIVADALRFDARGAGTAPRRIVANLPYNIGTKLLLGWLVTPQAYESITVMLQKEVVDRLAAAVDAEAYGRLSIAAQWHWHVEPLFDVPAAAFVPAPKVDSRVVRLSPRAAPVAPADHAALERVVAAAFGQRRKMLRSALRSLGGDTTALLAAAAIDGTRRAETLSIDEFCRLARAWSARGQ
jgi:16S rRNA (adenine1518-N6/adenine1519-N6)-dimethyltransferase